MFDWIQNDVPTPSTSIDSVGTPISEQATSRMEERLVVELAESGRRAKQGEMDGPEVEGGGPYYDGTHKKDVNQGDKLSSKMLNCRCKLIYRQSAVMLRAAGPVTSHHMKQHSTYSRQLS
ncbi:hypothetical protein B0H14DRAFT_2564748 [Mycena olivaceomarginata]|nr:hypothetical protein B0H14DRAFT_2564748 [Mycena olivaceomarginata]